MPPPLLLFSPPSPSLSCSPIFPTVNLPSSAALTLDNRKYSFAFDGLNIPFVMYECMPSVAFSRDNFVCAKLS